MPDKIGSKKYAAFRTAMSAALLCFALALSYLERFIPLSLVLPGIKPGLGNIAVITAAYTIGPILAAAVTAGKVLISAILFGNVSSLIYSASGAALAWCAAAVCVTIFRRHVSMLGASVLAAAFHNIGQLIAASLVLSSAAVFMYLPVLLLTAILTGGITGMLSLAAVRFVEKINPPYL